VSGFGLSSAAVGRGGNWYGPVAIPALRCGSVKLAEVGAGTRSACSRGHLLALVQGSGAFEFETW
jgi:hypothetical protein